MKKHISIFHRNNVFLQFAVLIILGAAVLLTLFLPQLSQLETKPRTLAVSVMINDEEGTSLNNIRLGMEQAADKLDVEIRFITFSLQDNDCEKLALREINEGIDALVVASGNPLTIDSFSSKTERACPVVCLGASIDGALSVPIDNAAIGKLLAEALISDSGDGAVLLLNSPDEPVVSIRLEAARKTLEEAGIETAVITLDETDTGQKLNDILYENHSDRVMTFSRFATFAAAQSETNCSIYGVGSGLPLISSLEDGKISALAVWSEYAAGYLAVDQAVNSVRGNKISDKTLDFSIIRGENIYEADNQKLLFLVVS